MENPERRKFTRIPFDASARIQCAAGTFDSEIIDISLKGALLKRPKDLVLAQGEPAQVVIYGSNNSFTISISAIIEHLEDEALGLEYSEIDIDSATHLRRLIELNLGDENLLNRELAELANPSHRHKMN